MVGRSANNEFSVGLRNSSTGSGGTVAFAFTATRLFYMSGVTWVNSRMQNNH